jgi:hypothetical protein
LIPERKRIVEERPLTFKSNDDKTPVTFTEEEQKDFKKAIQGINLVVHTLNGETKENRLTAGYKETLGLSLETYATDLLKVLKHDSVLAKEREERYHEIRSLNNENRELRSQLGNKVSSEDIREGMKNLTKNIRTWWSQFGLGHVSNGVHFTDNGILVTFSGSFSDSYYLKDEDEGYENKKTKVNRFISEGYDIVNPEKPGEASLMVTKNNIDKLTKLIKSRFPSAFPREMKSVFWSNAAEVSQIREFEILIRNLDDI